MNIDTWKSRLFWLAVFTGIVLLFVMGTYTGKALHCGP